MLAGAELHPVPLKAEHGYLPDLEALPEEIKERLLAGADQRRSKEGVVVIKAQRHRSLELNREEALGRLADLIRAATRVPRVRKATQPTRAAKRRRVDEKTQRGRVKSLRGKRVDD